jgi:hypothetical protein
MNFAVQLDRQIDVERQLRQHPTGLDQLGITNQQRDTERFIICCALVAELVLTPEIAVVGGVDEDGAVELAGLLQGLEHLADAVVYGLKRAELIQDLFIRRRAFSLLHELSAVTQDALAGEIVVDAGSAGNLLSCIEILMSLRRQSRVVPGFFAEEKQIRFVMRSSDEINGEVVQNVREVALRLDVRAAIGTSNSAQRRTCRSRQEPGKRATPRRCPSGRDRPD